MQVILRINLASINKRPRLMKAVQIVYLLILLTLNIFSFNTMGEETKWQRAGYYKWLHVFLQ